jgi:hypothetical protein
MFGTQQQKVDQLKPQMFFVQQPKPQFWENFFVLFGRRRETASCCVSQADLKLPCAGITVTHQHAWLV